MIHFTLKKVLIKRIKKIVKFFLTIAFLLNLCYLARSLGAPAEIVAWVIILSLVVYSIFYFGEESPEAKIFGKQTSIISVVLLFIFCFYEFHQDNFNLVKYLTLWQIAIPYLIYPCLTIIAFTCLHLFIVKGKISSGNGLLKLYKEKGDLFFTNNEVSYTELDKNLANNFDIRSLGVSPCK